MMEADGRVKLNRGSITAFSTCWLFLATVIRAYAVNGDTDTKHSRWHSAETRITQTTTSCGYLQNV
jgi:hypothetical protein